ncbi:MAG TPA: two-component sensor histidine kinase, partial [Gammaproteobacteria bacterium]|nr:two-component sensor histidine kinase [Gammaproteobacteria bacterium]
TVRGGGDRAQESQDFFVLSYGVLWEDGRSEYKFSVVEDVTPYYSEISNFRASLWGWLGGVAVLLLCIQFFLLRWG